MTNKKRTEQEKENDKKLAICCLNGSGEISAICMDLESVLLAPSLNASALYYRTKLTVHNFTVYNLATKDVMCFVWHEAEGGLTANEFASCVIDFLENQITSTSKK